MFFNPRSTFYYVQKQRRTNKQEGPQSCGHCDMLPSRIISDTHHKSEAFPLMKCIRRQMGLALT